VVIPVFGWIAGLVLLWSSQDWTTRDKWIGTLIIPGGLMLPLYFLLSPSEVCSTVTENGQIVSSTCSGPSGLAHTLALLALGVAIAAPIATAVYLARRASTLSKG
jgi:hypothetical protein